MDSKFFIFKKQNSSFSSNKKSLYICGKKKLNKSQIKVIENLCFYEMKALSYDCKKMIIFLKNIIHIKI